MLCFFFLNSTATTEIYPLSLHDALPICPPEPCFLPYYRTTPDCKQSTYNIEDAKAMAGLTAPLLGLQKKSLREDRKSTRLNSSHANISYAVFCLKKKKKST